MRYDLRMRRRAVHAQKGEVKTDAIPSPHQNDNQGPNAVLQGRSGYDAGPDLHPAPCPLHPASPDRMGDEMPVSDALVKARMQYQIERRYLGEKIAWGRYLNAATAARSSLKANGHPRQCACATQCYISA